MSEPVTLPRARTRLRLAVVIAAVLAGVGVLAAFGLDESVVYYRTPTELVADPALAGEPVRVGGEVVPGSLRRDADSLWFTLSDGTTDLPVVYEGEVSGVFQEGQGALVEGVLGTDGTFRGERLMVKHSEDYQAPDGNEVGR